MISFLAAFTAFLVIDAIGTLMLIRAARKNPVLRDRIDAAFGQVIRREARPSYQELKNCPFCE